MQAIAYLCCALRLVLMASLAQGSESYTCATPTTFNESRLPAILEVENLCSTAGIAMCLDFSETLFPMVTIPPNSSRSISAVLQDCLIVRLETCEGSILLEHVVTGTRKLSARCSPHMTDQHIVSMSPSIPLDCTLTTTPQISAVFAASREYIPVEIQPQLSPLHIAILSSPTEPIALGTLLETIYRFCYRLCLHGVPPYSALSIFRHARAVIWHTQQCRPELLGSQLLLSHAYTGLYGAAIAALHATTREKGKWREQAVLPTEAQRKAFEALLARAVALPVDEVLPAELQPGLREGVRDAWRGYDTEQEKAGGIERMNMVRTVSGEQFCKLDKNRHWVYYKITKKEVRYSKVDCCSPACLGFPHLTGFSGGAFTANCCLRCNWERCAGKMTVASRAVFELGEVQMPGASSPSLGRRQRILVLL